MAVASENEAANEVAPFLANAARVRLGLLDREIGWTDVGLIDAGELRVTSDLTHHILNRCHSILRKNLATW